jgi:ABC-type Fe3+-hydroxamate transport system substrate-binding protein
MVTYKVTIEDRPQFNMYPLVVGRLAGVLGGLLLALACGGSPVQQDELRVISLSPALTRIVFALDAGDALIGVDRFSQELEGAAELPSLGGLFAPDLERAVELAPTLVLAIESAQQLNFLDQVRARGVRVETFSGHTLADVLASFRRIGVLLDRGPRGAELAASVQRELDGLAAESAGSTPRVAVIIETDPLYVVGGGSFVQDLIEAAGGANAFEDLAAAYPRVSLEVLAERAPDVLIDTTHLPDEMETALLQSRQFWARFPWTQRVEVLPQGILTLPGPDLPEAARMLRARIHP